MTLPGSRYLRSWWESLADYEPRYLWYAHLLLHRVEVLVEVQGLSPLEQLDHALLGWIAACLPESREQLCSALHVPDSYLNSLLARLHALGRITLDPPRLTAAGLEWWQARATASLRLERRCFAFLDGSTQPFVALAPEGCQPLAAVPADWHWQPKALESALAQPTVWKTQHGFPTQVVRWLRLPSEASEMHSPRVPLVHAQQAFLVLVESGRDHGAILGFPVSPEAGHLDPTVVWRLPDRTTLEELAPPELDRWRDSWLAWCQARQLPLADAQACQLSQQGHTLHVQAPPRLIEQLRQGRSESLEGTAWILAAHGRIRPAARLYLQAKEAVR
ncbi:MAG: hypothetical protein SNJ75_09255 [Gemmataceae bacterium]